MFQTNWTAFIKGSRKSRGIYRKLGRNTEGRRERGRMLNIYDRFCTCSNYLLDELGRGDDAEGTSICLGENVFEIVRNLRATFTVNDGTERYQ
jgi:hypothetical protein